jgi:ribosomal protein S18 acetylase RimI-like enzyme
MRIREYRPPDFERLYRIDQAAFAPHLAYSRAELRYYIQARRGRTLLAEDAEDAAAAVSSEDRILGFVVARCAQRGWGTVVTLDVDPAAQRRGIGGRLLAAIEAWLAGEGVRVVWLETAADESGARHFYEKHGYQLGARLPGYYHGRLDAYSMVKRLAAAGQTRLG